MIIAIDLDSTLNNLIQMWLQWYNRDSGERISSYHIKSWQVHKYVPCGTNIYSYLNNPALYEACIPQPYSIEVTKELSRRHELVIVSAISKNTYDVKKEWCNKHFPHIKHFVGTHSKQFIGDVLIDDGIHNLETYKGLTICYNQPYNQDWGGVRVYNWQEVLELI